MKKAKPISPAQKFARTRAWDIRRISACLATCNNIPEGAVALPALHQAYTAVLNRSPK